VAAATRKDTGPAGERPVPTETVAVLGVAEPEAATAFYAAVGLTVDRDYGSRFIDVRLTPGTCRLGLMPGKALAKDAGHRRGRLRLPCGGRQPQGRVREEVDAPPGDSGLRRWQNCRRSRGDGVGRYSGHFTDPDGFLWKVASA
jgi:hypothetical protein